MNAQYVTHDSSNRRASCQHAVHCLGRLVRAIFGPDALAEDKTEAGPCLCILGIEFSMSWRGFVCRPARRKTVKWVAGIDAVVKKHKLSPGEASKMAGRLSWGCSNMFRRIGRAMLRPIFDQKSRRDGALNADLLRSLLWWKDVLNLEFAELRPWKMAATKPLHLFCDAAGTPPHLGAVLFCDEQVWWTHMDVQPSMLEFFRMRRDRQIMGLELLAISLGLATFQSFLVGRNVVVH